MTATSRLCENSGGPDQLYIGVMVVKERFLGNWDIAGGGTDNMWKSMAT